VQCGLFDLIAAYGQVKARTAPVVHMVARRPVMTLESALARVGALLGMTLEWLDLSAFLPVGEGRMGRSAAAPICAGQQLSWRRWNWPSRARRSWHRRNFGPLRLRAWHEPARTICCARWRPRCLPPPSR
jgi:hypothetical protein